MFTKRKFLKLPITQQHKKCAEMLRRIDDDRSLVSHYNELQQWMGQEQAQTWDRESMSHRYHQHLKQANMSVREDNFLPKIRQGDNTQPLKTPWPIAVFLDNIRSAHNVGSILRTVEAFSLGAVYFSQATPFTDHKQVRKTSMGTSSHVRCFRNASLNDLPPPIVVLETSPDAMPIHHFLFPEIFTLVVGNEEYGCSQEVLRHGHVFLEIPLRGRKNSLNVANAFAIAAAEIARQKE